MLNPKVLEAWFTLLAEAMRGTEDSQKAFKMLSEMSSTPEELNRWVAKFMPGAASAVNFKSEGFDTQLEDWWRMMGFVPRSRYLDLLERYDTLERKYRRAEETIAKLRANKGSQADPSKVVDVWGSVMADTMKAQADFMQSWMSGGSKEAKDKKSGEKAKPAEKKEELADTDED